MLVAPFPWFGGKRRVAEDVWRRFGDVANYVEPFAGSLAVLLRRPASHRGRVETVNDADGFVSNFWRAVSAEPDGVAEWADWPVNENDLHARHAWLVEQRPKLTARLEGDPEFYDVRVAGWWVWGVCAWIGSGFCSGEGPWHVVDGELVHGDAGRKRPRSDEPGGSTGNCRTWAMQVKASTGSFHISITPGWVSIGNLPIEAADRPSTIGSIG